MLCIVISQSDSMLFTPNWFFVKWFWIVEMIKSNSMWQSELRILLLCPNSIHKFQRVRDRMDGCQIKTICQNECFRGSERMVSRRYVGSSIAGISSKFGGTHFSAQWMEMVKVSNPCEHHLDWLTNITEFNFSISHRYIACFSISNGPHAYTFPFPFPY